MGLDIAVGFEQVRLALATVWELAHQGGELPGRGAVHRDRAQLPTATPVIVVDREARRRRDFERCGRGEWRQGAGQLLLGQIRVVAVGCFAQHGGEQLLALSRQSATCEDASTPVQ